MPEVGDTARERLTTLTVEGDIPSGTRIFTWTYSSDFGASALRVRESGSEIVRTAFLTAGETSESFDLGGVRTNFTMPDVLSVGLGGGTIVRIDDAGKITLGPDSVGYRLTEEAQVFGGSTLTTSDIAVARGVLDIGDRSLLQGFTDDQCEDISEHIHRKVEAAIDQLKTSATKQSNQVTR